jgi:TatA/E family protein of Tat protein translocase
MPNIFQGDVLLIILAIILVIFGGKKLPELARSLGKAKNEFKKGQEEEEGEKEKAEQKAETAE